MNQVKEPKRKSKSMRVALLLLALALITSCFVGGTFAKYVTSDNGTDSARVAKWGVQVTANVGSGFANAYEKHDTRTGPANLTAITQTVVGDNGAKVIAPGTSGSLGSIKVEGTPEVAVEVNIEANLELSGWTIYTGYYCPIVIKVGNKSVSGLDYDSMEEFKAAVEKEITGENATQYFAPNTDLSTKGFDKEISWSWAFVGSETETDPTYGQTDVNDTALGNLETAPTIKLTVTATVTQVD